MVVEILVNAIDRNHSDPVINARGCWKKGYPVVAKEQGWNWGMAEGPPLFKMVTVTDAPSLEAVLAYVSPWKRQTAYEILAHDSAADHFHVRIFSNPETVGTNTAGAVTKAEMEAFLLSWGATAIADGVNFEITAWDAMYDGTGYITFGDEDEYVEFTKTSYDPATGVYVVLMDYSLSAIKEKNAAEQPLIQAQCRIISHDEDLGQIVFETDRLTMISYLENEVRKKFDIMIGRAAFYFSANVSHGTTMTFTELEASIVDIRTV